VGNMSTDVYAKFQCTLLRIKKVELPSRSKNPVFFLNPVD